MRILLIHWNLQLLSSYLIIGNEIFRLQSLKTEGSKDINSAIDQFINDWRKRAEAGKIPFEFVQRVDSVCCPVNKSWIKKIFGRRSILDSPESLFANNEEKSLVELTKKSIGNGNLGNI